MSGNDFDNTELAKWDPEFIEQVRKVCDPIAKLWFRAEVRGLEFLPPAGGALLVSNHSGGAMTPDLLVLAPAFYEKFGYDRPLYTLGHDGLFKLPLAATLRKIGVIHASPENAVKALLSSGIVLVFPGGDYDAYRSTFAQNTINFHGRKGYVRAAIEAGVPIVPSVSIGGQETQLFLMRGDRLAKRLGLHRFRMEILPLGLGLPFGLTSTIPANFPLPSKIVTEVLKPIDIPAQFGADPDVDEVDAHVRAVMQEALDRLARQRRFPVLG
ncbi:glycerol acyltransferase [Mycobacterium sp. GA-1285]|uniref:lysophospholipid acyltransferase family protein n=1 Tax=Mycobacterium sp. GA-1285 TaxID=1772282 RepID=UPI000748DDD7|nr:lysophospholipid acyltransferase family protein [Mycobacterium sp. GA-1285]KUI22821.1 glycerol acyltransferase [Mycobacterium sp. GA-1285]